MRTDGPAAAVEPEVDRSAWLSKAAAELPEALNLWQRFRPLERAETFSRSYYRGHITGAGKLREAVVLQLIRQYLVHEGLTKSAQVLEREGKLFGSDEPVHDDESRLVTLLRLAVGASDRLWDLTISDKNVPEDLVLQELEAHLFTLGVLEEDDDRGGVDINIWEESEEGNIIYSEKTSDQIKAASLNQLVTKLTAAKQVDMAFTKTFLMTYQSFTSPDKFFAKLLQRYHVSPKTRSPDMPEATWRAKVVMPINLRVCNVLRKWMEDYFEDIAASEKLLHKVKTFVEGTLRVDGHANLSTSLSNLLNRKLNPAMAKTKKKYKSLVPPPEPKVNLKRLFSPTLNIHEIDEEELARQLTLVTFHTYRSIQPSELLNLNWSKAKTRHRSPNVLKLISTFNEISQWTAAAILSQDTIRSRIKMYASFIKIAEHLRALNNFNGLMSVLSGLHNAAVNRLKFTKEELPASSKATLEALSADVDNKNAYAAYRKTLANSDPPLIPYLGTYLTDLTFIEEGNKNEVDGLINLYKRQLVYDVISRVQQYQLTEYNLQPVVQIQALFSRLPRKEDDELYAASLRLEPRKADRSTIK